MNNTPISKSFRESFSAHGAQVTFAQQKNEWKFDIMSQENTSDKQLNPITVAASLVWRNLKTPGANDDTTICYCHDENFKLRNFN